MNYSTATIRLCGPYYRPSSAVKAALSLGEKRGTTSLRRLTTIRDIGRTSHERSEIGSKKQDHIRHLFGPAQSSHGNDLVKFCDHGRLRGARQQRRIDSTRA